MELLRRSPARLVVALLMAAGLVLAGSGAASATARAEIPAPDGSGISATVLFHGQVVPQPYHPDPDAAFGDRKCRQIYHDYDPTPGCGGFKLDFTLHNVRSRPGYQAGLYSTDYYFNSYADTARTFGCLRPDGTFDHRTAFVVRTEHEQLMRTYYFTEANWVISDLRSDPTRDSGPQFYVNFPAVQVNCPDGMTPTQFGLKVTNVSLTIADDNVFGHTTWTTPGPFYA